jgi:hypothetical protein
MSLYQRFFAHTLAWGDDAQHRLYGDYKRSLFAGLEGTVVEIGPGTGVNLPYLPDGLRWIGLEPNPHMHGHIRGSTGGPRSRRRNPHRSGAGHRPAGRQRGRRHQHARPVLGARRGGHAGGAATCPPARRTAPLHRARRRGVAHPPLLVSARNSSSVAGGGRWLSSGSQHRGAAPTGRLLGGRV